ICLIWFSSDKHEGKSVMKKCLITGGAGFIGSHLVEECLMRGFKVIVLDNLSTGKRGNLPSNHRDLEFIEGDITDAQQLSTIIKNNGKIDYVFHLAAIPSITLSKEDPVYAPQVNFVGTLMLLNAFRDQRIRKFVYTSSSAVYGDTREIPVGESAPPAPISPYGADKMGGEYFLKIFNDSFGLPTVACRLFNVFGERQDPSSPYSGVISIFFDRVMAGKQGKTSGLPIYGDGNQSRDFIYVKDIARALLSLAESEKIRGEVFNVGYGSRTTVLELADRIRRLLDVEIDLSFHEPREGDILHSQAAVEKLKATGFEFKYDFDEGLKRLASFLLNTKNP
ncbi:MAG: SDR family NAD(P)-dependent oxidoreductase, partial [Desulfobacterales bacterium]|nr:SDR family NAD(P)-dependent oxidoreductase [Desulfobacterales bacterium]